MMPATSLYHSVGTRAEAICSQIGSFKVSFPLKFVLEGPVNIPDEKSFTKPSRPHRQIFNRLNEAHHALLGQHGFADYAIETVRRHRLLPESRFTTRLCREPMASLKLLIRLRGTVRTSTTWYFHFQLRYTRRKSVRFPLLSKRFNDRFNMLNRRSRLTTPGNCTWPNANASRLVHTPGLFGKPFGAADCNSRNRRCFRSYRAPSRTPP
jgi:hypothetical protein